MLQCRVSQISGDGQPWANRKLSPARTVFKTLYVRRKFTGIFLNHLPSRCAKRTAAAILHLQGLKGCALLLGCFNRSVETSDGDGISAACWYQSSAERMAFQACRASPYFRCAAAKAMTESSAVCRTRF